MGAAALPRTEITIARGTVALRQDELDRLLRALRAPAVSCRSASPSPRKWNPLSVKPPNRSAGWADSAP